MGYTGLARIAGPGIAGIAGTYYSSRRGDPLPREFLGWAMLFGAAECLAAVAPPA